MSRRILVVEDDPDIQDYLCLVLADPGLELVRASNGIEALAVLDAGPAVELILLDVIMPLMDGEEFLRQLRHVRCLSTPVLVTSVDDEMAARLARVAEVQGTFLKGAGGAALRAAVRSLLA
jgi:CheY-like chemotaxis protein